MSWFGGNTQTLCEELNATSTNTVAARQKVVDNLLPTVRGAVVAEIRTFAKQNRAMETTVNLDTLFSENHESSLLIYFRRANGAIKPSNPTSSELHTYCERIAEDLKTQGLVVSYENTPIITINWETVPEPVKIEVPAETPK